MKFKDFQQVMSPGRMNRYLIAAGSSKAAMTLYRRNLSLSQELFTIISCFEITLRNAIDAHFVPLFGPDWLRDAASAGGMFSNPRCFVTAQNINDAVTKLSAAYTHNKLVAELGFGFWRYMFAPHQFQATGQTLLAIFPGKPPSTPTAQYNAKYIFNQLVQINNIRNRIAHHEPICFIPGQPIKDTTYSRQNYTLIKQLFQWMNVNESALLYGLDHVIAICDNIDNM